MKTLVALTTATLVLAGTAQAGSMQDPVVETPPVVVDTPVSLGGDWTGPYAGLSFGQLSADSAGTSEDGQVYGLFGGYDYDFGQFVLGAEIEYQATDDFRLGGVDIDDVTRLKLRGGFDAGPALLYVTAGAARANTSLGDANGAVYGLGMDYKVTERFTVGAEYLNHDFNDVGNTGTDINADTISLRAAFRF